MERPRFSSGPLLALLSAALFGASTPFTKLLLGDGIDAWLLAGLLYLGSGLGLSLVSILRRGAGNEAPLTRRDWGWMALVVLAGGVTGPVLLMIGLSSTPASSAALLLNVEGLATMGIAWLVFRENVDRRLLIGAVAILAGAVLLSWRGGPGGIGLGALAIVGACLAWGIDNNLTRKLSASDPVQIAMVKGLVAGGVNLALGLARGAHLPALPALAGAGLVGFLGWREPRAVRAGFAPSRLGANRRLLLFSTVHRGDPGDHTVRRARDRTTDRGGSADVDRALSASRRTPRPRTRP